MKNYICKWPNDDVVFITARDKQQVREVSAMCAYTSNRMGLLD